MMMHVNLRAPFLCLQEAVKSMKERGGGSIVNIGSVNAYIGEPKLGPYSVSKGGLMTMTRNAAAALSKYRIRVNQINVGWTLTEGEERVKRQEEHDPDWLPKAIATRPFGRLLTPADVARAAEFFASDDSALATGSVMDLEQYPVGAPPNWSWQRLPGSASFPSATSTSWSKDGCPTSSGSVTRRHWAAMAWSTTTDSSGATRERMSSRSSR
jgi:hypothetical protein